MRRKPIYLLFVSFHSDQILLLKIAQVEEGAGSDKREKPPSEDCYFDPECHKLVDWALVTEAKTSSQSGTYDRGWVARVSISKLREARFWL